MKEEETRMSEPLSLVEELATVPDPRSRKGRRHPLTAILSLTAVAILAGMKSLDAIAQFGRDHGWDAIALDGKTARGSADGDAPGVHLLTAYVPDAAAVLKQLRVDAKTNEHKAALTLLGVLPLRGKVVTGDAMFTHRDVAEEIRRRGGDYILIVKDNQPELKA